MADSIVISVRVGAWLGRFRCFDIVFVLIREQYCKSVLGYIISGKFVRRSCEFVSFQTILRAYYRFHRWCAFPTL
jgi:hypothetical protein